MKFRHLTLLLSLFLLASCSKVSMENYNKLKTGMDYKEVVDIIGDPDSCSEQLGTRSCIWGDKDSSNIKVKFLGDNAVLFSNKDLN